MPTTKKIPQRMCVCCRTMHDKRDLVRVVKTPEGVVQVDYSGKANGRGAYLCRDEACVARVFKTRPLSRIFETEVPETVYERLKEALTKPLSGE